MSPPPASSGQSDLSILTGEILPNLLPVIVITFSTTLGWMILETAGLSFLGLGAQPPQADLGSMLGEGRSLLLVAPHIALIPGLVILLVVIGINLVGDGIRDLVDPRLGIRRTGPPRPRHRRRPQRHPPADRRARRPGRDPQRPQPQDPLPPQRGALQGGR